MKKLKKPKRRADIDIIVMLSDADVNSGCILNAICDFENLHTYCSPKIKNYC